MWSHGYLNGLGLVCVFIMHGLCFHDGRDAWSMDIPASYLLVGAILGTGGSAFLLPIFRNWTGCRGALLRAMPGLVAAFLLPAGMLWMQPWLTAMACACGAFPLVLFIDNIVMEHAGKHALYLGSVFGVAVFFWQLPTIFPEVGTHPCIEICLAGICAISSLCAAFCGTYGKTIPRGSALPRDTKVFSERRMAYETLAYMTGISLAFFLLNATLDWQFYRMHARDFHIPAWAYLYIWAIFPITGYWLEKYRVDSRILLFCLAVNLLAPLLVVPLEGTVFYWVVYVFGLLVKGIGLVFLLCVFCQFRAGFGKILPHGIVLCMPWLCHMLTFLIADSILTHYISIIPYYFLILILIASFGYISIHVQYALTLTGCVILQHDKNTMEQSEKHDGHSKRYTVEASKNTINDIAIFSKKYGISNREQDVLSLLIDGYSTNDIGTMLNISQNTFKSHMRQLLRKTECSNRTALVALYFQEQNSSRDA